MKQLAIVIGAVMLSASPAAAQSGTPPPASPCQAEPDRNGDSGSDRPDKPPPPGDLTKKLAPCNGVLKPPPTGDSDLTAPAPDQGNTPVIRPGDLPPQPPKK